jgi:glucose-6-phosphate-specific signal transduction histidine kinase
MGMTYIFFQKGKISMQFQWKGNSQTLDNTMTLTLIRMTKDEKGLAFFKGLLL